MKYIRDSRVWRDLRLLSPPVRRRLQRAPATLREARIAGVRAAPATHERHVGLAPTGDACPTGRQVGMRATLRGAAALLLATPVSSPGQSPAPVAYRAPTIAMVQPLTGGTVPRDKPIVVFRFARGEAADPIDVGTFAVTVNGVDRTRQFQVTAEEAWGPFTVPMSADTIIALGTHALAARICSVRGACAEAASTVVAVDAPTVTTASAEAAPPKAQSTRSRVLELMLDALRKLIVP